MGQRKEMGDVKEMKAMNKIGDYKCYLDEKDVLHVWPGSEGVRIAISRDGDEVGLVWLNHRAVHKLVNQLASTTLLGLKAEQAAAELKAFKARLLRDLLGLAGEYAKEMIEQEDAT